MPKVGNQAAPAEPAPAAQPTPGAQKPGHAPRAVAAKALPFDEAVQVGQLENGLSFYIRRHPQPEGKALLWLAVDAGSVLEEPGQQGVAHFVQHMALRGTERFTRSTLVDFMERAGMRLGTDQNAFTSFDQTVYMLSVPTQEPGFVFQGLDILQDWASSIRFEPEAVERERAVMLAEWREGRVAGQRVFDQQWPVLLGGSRYAERKPIGDKRVLETVEAAALRDFYRKWYRPESLAVIAVGDIEVAQVRGEIEKRFGGFRAPPDAPPRPSFPVPLLRETRALVIADPDVASTRVSLAVKGPAVPHRSESDHRAHLVSELFHGLLRQRLSALAGSPESAFAASFNFTVAMARAVDVLQLTAVAKQGQAVSALARLILELRRAGEHGFSEGEFERARRSLERSLRQAVAADTIGSREHAADLLHYHLDGQALLGPQFALALGQRLLSGISRQEVQEFAKNWWEQEDRVLMAMGPRKSALPQEDDLLATLADVEAQAVEPYRDASVGEALLPTLPTPGAIVARRPLPAVDALEYQLSNGAVVALKRTEHEPGRLRLRAVSPGGHSLVAEAGYPSAKFAAAVVGASGAGTHSLADLKRNLKGRVVALSPTLDEFEEGFTGQAATSDAETLFQLIYLYATQPRRDLRAFEAWQAAQRRALQEREADPRRAFFERLIASTYDQHPRRRPVDSSMLERVRLDDMMRVYRDRFEDISDFKFVVVGDIEPAELEPLLESYLAGLPGRGRKERYRDVGARGRSGRTRVRLKQSQDPQAFLLFNFHGHAQWEAEAEDDLGALADFLSLQMAQELPDALGPFAIGSFDRRPVDEFSLALGFGCDPGQLQPLRSRLWALLEDAKSVSGEERVAELRAMRRKALESRLADNAFWVERLVAHYRFDSPLESPEEMLQRVERIGPASLQRAAKRFLSAEQYVDGLLMPAE